MSKCQHIPGLPQAFVNKEINQIKNCADFINMKHEGQSNLIHYIFSIININNAPLLLHAYIPLQHLFISYPSKGAVVTSYLENRRVVIQGWPSLGWTKS